MTNAANAYYTSRTNDLGDVLCVVEAYNDWGQRGWMVCVEERPEGRKPRRTPKVWFEDRLEACSDAERGHYRDFPAPC